MIELAPHHKTGLPVANPLLLAGGIIGYGEAKHPSLATERLGGVVVGPILWYSRGGASGLRLAQLNGGFVLETGLQNRGLNTVLRQFAGLWPRLGTPVIAQLADDQPAMLGRVAARLAAVPGLSGLELLPPPAVAPELLRSLVQAATRASDLPVWVKLPLANATQLAPVAVDAGAVGLVIGQPSLGSARRGSIVLTGSLFGPLTFAATLTVLVAVAGLGLECALLACGGIYTASHLFQALEAGASAVQIDAAVWAEPALPGWLLAHWQAAQRQKASVG